MTSLTRDQIFAARNILREKVAVPEWGGDVYVQVMSGTERDAYEMAIYQERQASTRNMRAKLIVWCLVDEHGNKVFKPEDAAELGLDSCIPLDRVALVAQRLNRLSERDLEDIKGNSEPSLGAEPSSASP